MGIGFTVSCICIFACRKSCGFIALGPLQASRPQEDSHPSWLLQKAATCLLFPLTVWLLFLSAIWVNWLSLAHKILLLCSLGKSLSLTLLAPKRCFLLVHLVNPPWHCPITYPWVCPTRKHCWALEDQIPREMSHCVWKWESKLEFISSNPILQLKKLKQK